MAARTHAIFRSSLPARRRLSVLGYLVNLMALYRQRKQLSELSDHLLDDIGLCRKSAQKEAERPIWDAPDHWMR